MDLFNIVVPLLAGDPMLYGKAAKQVIKINEEDPQDWLPDAWLQEEIPGQSLFVQNPAMQQMMGGQGQMPVVGGKNNIVPSNQTSMQGAAGTRPLKEGPKVVPQQQTNMPSIPGATGEMRREMI